MSNLIADADLSNSISRDTSIELVVFEIGTLVLALPILQVQKVIEQNEIYGSGLSHINLTHLEDSELAIVDLHQKIFGTSLTQSSETGYFIISKNTVGEPLGIVVSQAPTLIDVSIDRIRMLPDAYRRSDTLEIASHVAVLSSGEATKTIFILDLNSLV